MPFILQSILNYNIIINYYYYRDCQYCTNYFEKKCLQLWNRQVKPLVKLVPSLHKTAMNTLRAGWASQQRQHQTLTQGHQWSDYFAPCISLVYLHTAVLNLHCLNLSSGSFYWNAPQSMPSVKIPCYPRLVHLIQNLCLVTVEQILGTFICILRINFYFSWGIPKRKEYQKSIRTLLKRLSQLCWVILLLSSIKLYLQIKKH